MPAPEARGCALATNPRVDSTGERDEKGAPAGRDPAASGHVGAAAWSSRAQESPRIKKAEARGAMKKHALNKEEEREVGGEGSSDKQLITHEEID